MPRPVTVTVSHDLGKEEARRRIEEGFGKLKSQMTGGMMFSFTEQWAADDKLTFNARGLGQNINGVIDVFPQHVRIEVVLPSVLASVAEIITGKLQKESTILLEKK